MLNKELYKKKWKERISGEINSLEDFYSNRDCAIYNSQYDRISWCNKTRRDPVNPRWLQVRCKQCKEWFNPTKRQVNNRLRCLDLHNGEANFYCSEDCKNECIIFKQRIHPKGKYKKSQRPDQQEWAKMVKERDGYLCQKCGSINKLNAHHIEGLKINPIESADIDIGITLCNDCHKLLHKTNGCTTRDLKCK